MAGAGGTQGPGLGTTNLGSRGGFLKSSPTEFSSNPNQRQLNKLIKVFRVLIGEFASRQSLAQTQIRFKDPRSRVIP